jgi:hypothetical protein
MIAGRGDYNCRFLQILVVGACPDFLEFINCGVFQHISVQFLEEKPNTV